MYAVTFCGRLLVGVQETLTSGVLPCTPKQGSGWGWLGYNKATGRVEIATCANQDPLFASKVSNP
jgi:hypothetical protein